MAATGQTPPRLPVGIITGALGSGKTTLIRRILRDPVFTRTAVIVNEFGEVPLDHTLIASADESVLTLATGCLCCAVQTDLARTLMDLYGRRAVGAAAYDWVLIETSGLSDPAPMVQSLLGDAAVGATHLPPTVNTVVDSIHGAATLAAFPEARHQVALADRLMVTKTDLQPVSADLKERLSALNPGAPTLSATQVSPAHLFAEPPVGALSDRVSRLPASRAHAGVETFTLQREQPIPALALTLFLQALAEHCGPRLWRLKGLVALDEMPGQPAVVHGVRHVFSPPEFLPSWPGPDTATRIVFIGAGIPRHFPARLLDAIEAEVREELAAQPR